MRAITSVFCLAIAAAPALGSQSAALPPVVRAGLETYKINGAAAAVSRWLTNSPITAQFFFFSRRRRHTRFSRDWSSDVCSSDLRGLERDHAPVHRPGGARQAP